MKKLISILAIVLFVLGLISLSYGSMKMARAADETSQEVTRTDGDFEFSVKDENERRGDTSTNASYWLLGLSVILFVGSRGLKK